MNRGTLHGSNEKLMTEHTKLERGKVWAHDGELIVTEDGKSSIPTKIGSARIV